MQQGAVNMQRDFANNPFQDLCMYSVQQQLPVNKVPCKYAQPACIEYTTAGQVRKVLSAVGAVSDKLCML